tara:strand:+ start:4962 stop:5420 length:459 start_codon:yes stop_codon:yes gene_type:complete
MADAATVVMKTTVLPDEIAKTIEATTTVSPKDANDKWYYKLTSVTAASTDLMSGYYTDYTAVNANVNPTAVATGDKVEFIYIKNTDAANHIYVVFDAGTVANTTGDAIKISPNESFFARLPNATVADIHAIGHDGSSAATATCIVCALLDDV